MILADKIIHHRKSLGMTQEELAEVLSVSRQSISKWEGAQSIPDMNKIMLMSDLFGVSIDYLMREDMEVPEYLNDDALNKTKSVNLEHALKFLKDAQKEAKDVALGVFLIIISPITLILLGNLKDVNFISFTDDQVSAMGATILFLLVAVGVGLFIMNGFNMKQYKFLSDEPFDLEYGVEGAIKLRRENFEPIYRRHFTLSVMLIIIAVIPVLLAPLFDNTILNVISVPLLLLFVALGVLGIVNTSIQASSFKKLLQIDDYTPLKKKQAPIFGRIAGIYWLSATALYLGLSFVNDAWDKTWVIWPIAGVLFGIISIVVSIFMKES